MDINSIYQTNNYLRKSWWNWKNGESCPI